MFALQNNQNKVAIHKNNDKRNVMEIFIKKNPPN